MDTTALEQAILRLAIDADLLASVRENPETAGAQLGIDDEWAQAILNADRDRLRSAGLNDGITILVSRWFKGDLGDSESTGRFVVDTSVAPETPDLLDNLVFAGGCSHVPDLLARPEIDPEDAVSRLLEAYARLAQDIAAAELDVLLVSADCHFQKFGGASTVVGTGAAHTGSMSFFQRPDLDLTLTGHPQFAQALVDAVLAARREVEAAPRVDLDHGLIVPLRLMLPRPDLPVIPIITQPARGFSPFAAREFGAILRQVVVDSGLRVGMLATGGLSHWLDPGKFGNVDVEFDTYLLQMIQAGRGSDLSQLEPYALLDHGQYEFLNWLIMFGLVGPGVRGNVYAYEPMQASGGGWAVVNMDLAEARHRMGVGAGT